jgi:RNA polymerase sigma-70 factor (ECF subfamily)
MVLARFFLRILVNRAAPSIVDVSELRLVDEATGGDRDAQRRLFELHRDAAFRVALRITGRREDALDVVQDGFIRAFERLGEFQRGSQFRTWLLRIVSNRALDILRARKVRLAIPLDGEDDESRAQLEDRRGEVDPEADLERAELAGRLRRTIEGLPPDQRAVFALYATGDLTYGQIAEVLGIPIGTVMSRLYHARRRLHAQLSDLAPVPSRMNSPTASTVHPDDDSAKE